MKTAVVYYIDLTEEQRAIINGPDGDWSCPTGRGYLAAKDGLIDDHNAHFIRKAATVHRVTSAEDVWLRLQNTSRAWDDADPTMLVCHTDFPRSMDIGDLILWQDGQLERCDRVGFEPAGSLRKFLPIED